MLDDRLYTIRNGDWGTVEVLDAIEEWADDVEAGLERWKACDEAIDVLVSRSMNEAGLLMAKQRPMVLPKWTGIYGEVHNTGL